MSLRLDIAAAAIAAVAGLESLIAGCAPQATPPPTPTAAVEQAPAVSKTPTPTAVVYPTATATAAQPTPTATPLIPTLAVEKAPTAPSSKLYDLNSPVLPEGYQITRKPSKQPGRTVNVWSTGYSLYDILGSDKKAGDEFIRIAVEVEGERLTLTAMYYKINDRGVAEHLIDWRHTGWKDFYAVDYGLDGKVASGYYPVHNDFVRLHGTNNAAQEMDRKYLSFLKQLDLLERVIAK